MYKNILVCFTGSVANIGQTTIENEYSFCVENVIEKCNSQHINLKSENAIGIPNMTCRSMWKKNSILTRDVAN